MLRSMTGFGRAESKFKGGRITAELKTVNHKFFDATMKLPESLSVFEDKIKELLQKRIERGKVNLNLAYEGALSKHERVNINSGVARSYYQELLKLKRALRLKNDLSVKDMVLLPGVLSYEADAGRLETLWPRIKDTLEKALGKLIADREREGAAIRDDISKRAGRIDAMLSVISARAHLNVDEYRKRFAARVNDLTNGRQIDMGRLEMEVAIFAKNSDISEEVTRLKNHLANLKKTVHGDGEAGKKLDFIAQELHREINTVGSKASDFRISKNVIEIKSEIEKIREQAKNVE